jgi:ABC-2 type transport system permease protein
MSAAFFRVVTRELRAAFGSPVAYIVIVIFLTVTGWFFFTPFFLNGRADLREFFRLLPMTLGLVVPAVTMRVFSEEFSTGSYEVLTTLPMTRFDVLLGKFTGSLLFILLMLVPTLAYPIIVASLGDLDGGPVVGGYIGAVLLAALYCSVGLFASALTKNQIVAFIIGLALCAFLVLIDKVLFFIPAGLTGVLQYLGADFHFGNIAKGVLDSRDVVYFVSAAIVALYATNLVVERRI